MQKSSTKAVEGKDVKEMSDKHWTQDEELVELFILNKLNTEKRNELEDHLRICEVCKEEIRAQQLLIAGIRRSGREELKKRLRGKAGLLPEKQIPWPHILSTAAVTVILLSVGIYNRWFETVRQPENTVVLIHPDAAPVASKDSSAESLQPPADMRLDDKSIVTDDRSLSASKRKKETKTPTGSDLDEVADENKPAAIQSGRGGQGAGAISSQAESAQEAQADMIVAEPEIVWTEGTVLPSTEEEVRQKEKSQERGISNAYQFGKADAMKAAPSTTQKQAAKEQSILVAQRNTASLPLNQQQLRQKDIVPAKVERLGEQIQFTVYLDSLLDESDLARTTIEPAGNDSIIVNLPNQRLRYKLPVEWNKQLLAKPAK